MTTRTLIIIIAAALLAALAAVWVSSSRSPGNSLAERPGLLAPGLSEALASINQVRITGAGDSVLVTLERQENDVWGLVERAGYPVDLATLRQQLSPIVNAQRIEAKTAMPERHTQLGVEDVSAADAHGVRVDIRSPERTFSFVIGDNVARGTGTYVRVADEAQSWLVSNNIAIERNPANWLVKKIMDVGANRVATVTVVPEEGASIELVSTESDPASDFALTSLPRGREAAAGYQREALASLLSGLTFEDVFTGAEQPQPETTRNARFSLVDGRQLEIVSWQSEGRTYAQFEMTLDEEIAQAWIAHRPASEESAGDASTTTDAAAPASLDALRDEVKDFQRLHAGWVYQLPSVKASNLNKGLEDYLKPKD